MLSVYGMVSTRRFSLLQLVDGKTHVKTESKEKWAISLFVKWLKIRNSEGLLRDGELHIFKSVDITKTDLDYLHSL